MVDLVCAPSITYYCAMVLMEVICHDLQFILLPWWLQTGTHVMINYIGISLLIFLPDLLTLMSFCLSIPKNSSGQRNKAKSS